jgi:hypothetical protein
VFRTLTLAGSETPRSKVNQREEPVIRLSVLSPWQCYHRPMRSRLSVLLLMPLLLVAQDSLERDRKQIVAAYQRTIDALNRGDAGAALELETPDWVSITVGQKPVTRQEMEPLIRRDIASMKLPPDWAVVWKPDFEHNGTSTGIQIYDLKVSGDEAVVLYLVGSTQTETRNGETHRVWHGSHIRDTLIRTSAGWKRRMHEKLTVNEQMVDGRTVQTQPK